MTEDSDAGCITEFTKYIPTVTIQIINKQSKYVMKNHELTPYNA